jgi:LacI family transcriptional regulator
MPSPITNPKIIAVVGMSLHGQDAQILRGIASYAQIRNWRIQICGSAERDFRELEQNFEIRGIISHVLDMDMAAAFEAHQVPVVNISGYNPEALPFPYVNHDMTLAGKMAAEYFLQKGYRHFALEPVPERFNEAFISQGGQYFAQCLKDEGLICQELRESLSFTRISPEDSIEALDDFPICSLRDLPRPSAIFVLSDRLAARLCGLCQEQGISVPEDIAILGFGNFELICETAYPPLSSIATPDQELGRTAAYLLHQLLLGNDVPRKQTLLPPLGVISRRSTDALAIEDPAVAKAVHFIRQADLREINCDQVARASGMNRRTLERRFRQILGRSLYGEIQTWRSDQAKLLLQTTREPLYNIAIESGFRDADHMGKVLKQLLGKTPRQLRSEKFQTS